MKSKAPQQCAVIGTATFRPDQSQSLEEAIHHTTLAALKSAGLSVDDIGGIVVAGNDQLDGRAISIMMASGSVGGVGRDIQSTPSASEHAFVLAAIRVRSGLFKTQLVVSWSPLEADSVHDVEHLAADPYFHRSLPLDELSASALQACRLTHEVSDIGDAALGVAQKNLNHSHRREVGNGRVPQVDEAISKYWPFTKGMLAPAAYGVVAAVIASEEVVASTAQKRPAWITGLGWATEPSYLGDRDLAQLPSLKAAAHMAYLDAGVDASQVQFSLAEVADRTPYQEMLACEGLGLNQRREWKSADAQQNFAVGGRVPVNLSGGSTFFNPVFCKGLLSVVDAANQILGSAGSIQLEKVERVVAHAASGFAMQYNTVVVMQADISQKEKM